MIKLVLKNVWSMCEPIPKTKLVNSWNYIFNIGICNIGRLTGSGTSYNWFYNIQQFHLSTLNQCKIEHSLILNRVRLG